MNRRIFLAAGLFAASAALPAAAQNAPAKPGKGGRRGGRGGGHAAGKRFQAAIAKLNLRPDQKSKVDAAVKAYEAEAAKIQQGPETPDQKRPKLRAAGKAFRDKIETILTPDQRTKWKADRKQARQARLAANGGQPGAKKPTTGAKPATPPPTKPRTGK